MRNLTLKDQLLSRDTYFLIKAWVNLADYLFGYLFLSKHYIIIDYTFYNSNSFNLYNNHRSRYYYYLIEAQRS